MVVLVAVFAGASSVTARQMQVEVAVNDAVEGTLSEERYRALGVRSVRTRFAGVSVYRLDRQVTVTVSRPDDEGYPRLVDRLEAAVNAAIEDPATVEVVFVDRQSG